jgi:uncharacterized protein YbjT (DUF2867 family)
MAANKDRVIVVTGATGLQGGAVARHLLSGGWQVRALTRSPQGEKARALAALGADVIQGDMADPASLRPVFAGAYGVFSVQNPMISGIEGEIKQGKNVADAASQAGVQHVVYSSAGPRRRGTGVPSWESKLVIADYMQALGLPLTILRPMAFMDLMTEKKFYPSASTWHLMTRIAGSDRKIFWISADDLGRIAALAFAEPENYIGREIELGSDARSLDECRALYRDVMGKNPSRFPMPQWMFERFTGKDLTIMWRWLRDNTIDLDTQPTRAIHPGAKDVRAWLEQQKGAQ